MSQSYRRLWIAFSASACAALAAFASGACSHGQPAAASPPVQTAPPQTPIGETRPPVADPWAAIDEAGKAITGDLLRDQITKLSSDELEGRGPTTRGDQAARA